MAEVIESIKPQDKVKKESSLSALLSWLKIQKNILYLAIGVLVVGGGILTGWLLSGSKVGGSPKDIAPGAKSGANEAGITDESAFPDTATGLLEEGGVNGEGTHHLTREGGVSQTVYLTSTVIDLQSFVGKKVTVWGQTVTARKAGWLMDVGKIKVTE